MDNVFITQHFDWNRPGSWKARLVNGVLRRLGVASRLVDPSATGAMTNVEQRINMFHLISQALTFGVEGDLVELGTFYGSSAALMQMVVEQFDASRRLHVYDNFPEGSAEDLKQAFAQLRLRIPVMHSGDLEKTVPAELPDSVCFAHVDLGPGPSHGAHERSIRHAAESIYPRLSRGGVCLFADYCDPHAYARPGYRQPEAVARSPVWHHYPLVKRAVDEFLKDKPEKVYYLYAGEFSHGFFRKT